MDSHIAIPSFSHSPILQTQVATVVEYYQRWMEVRVGGACRMEWRPHQGCVCAAVFTEVADG